MKRYGAIAQVMLKAQLSWRFQIGLNAVLAVFKLIFAMIVWGAIFGQQTEVSGFTLPTMLTYYVASSFFSQLESVTNIGQEVAHNIRRGTFSRYMVLPVRPEGYFMASTAGSLAIYLALNLVFICVWVLILGIPLAFTPDPGIIACAVLMEILALVFTVQLDFFLGLMAMRFQDVGSFLMIKQNLVAFATGVIVPLALLPEGLQAVMRYLPFYYSTYLPSMLLIGRNTAEIGQGFIVLAAWMLAFAIINPRWYDHLRKKYDGVGI